MVCSHRVGVVVGESTLVCNGVVEVGNVLICDGVGSMLIGDGVVEGGNVLICDRVGSMLICDGVIEGGNVLICDEVVVILDGGTNICSYRSSTGR